MNKKPRLSYTKLFCSQVLCCVWDARTFWTHGCVLFKEGVSTSVCQLHDGAHTRVLTVGSGSARLPSDHKFLQPPCSLNTRDTKRSSKGIMRTEGPQLNSHALGNEGQHESSLKRQEDLGPKGEANHQTSWSAIRLDWTSAVCWAPVNPTGPLAVTYTPA